MAIFVVTLIAFALLTGVTVIAYWPLDRFLLAGRDPAQAAAKTQVEQSRIAYLSAVIYGSFVAFVYFILATAFSVELLHGPLGQAMSYLYLIFPLAIGGALAFFFMAKAFAIRLMK